MPKIKDIYKYPLAGAGGHEADSLIYSEKSIGGSSAFIVATEAELAEYLKSKGGHVPLRMTQTKYPELATLQTDENAFSLVLKKGYQRFDNQEHSVFISKSLREPITDFSDIDLTHLLKFHAIPFRASRSSTSTRWVIDCGDEASEWVTKHLDPHDSSTVRLLKIVDREDSTKNTGTWYHAIHAIGEESLAALGQQAKTNIDQRSFRANVVYEDSEAFAEALWLKALLTSPTNSTEADVKQTERCDYVANDPVTGQRRMYSRVLTTLKELHNLHFGVYLFPQLNGKKTVTVEVGDEIEVLAQK